MTFYCNFIDLVLHDASLITSSYSVTDKSLTAACSPLTPDHPHKHRCITAAHQQPFLLLFSKTFAAVLLAETTKTLVPTDRTTV